MPNHSQMNAGLFLTQPPPRKVTGRGTLDHRESVKVTCQEARSSRHDSTSDAIKGPDSHVPLCNANSPKL
jgi:hypothetical protein